MSSFKSWRRAPENFLSAQTLEDIQRAGFDAQRRELVAKAFLAATGSAAMVLSKSAWGASVAQEVLPAGARTTVGEDDPHILQLPPHTTHLGNPVAMRGYGLPSQYEGATLRRESPGLTKVRESSVAFTPLQNLFGIITPSGLHFERHHSGWSDIDPKHHRLMVHGLVKKPKVYTLDDLMRLPSVSRIHFLECGANTSMEWASPAVPTVQYTHGMLSCSEFTGVPLSVLLDDCGADLSQAQAVLAEGADGSSLTRSIPMDHALDDVLVAWGMNGEMLRPENGYPLRLVVPGVQGVSWVKWLRRLKLGDQKFATRDESIHYIDALPNGLYRQYSGIQECKSVITTPSGGQRLIEHGFYNITGLAWSGRGKIKRVDVSVDGGRNWQTAALQEPVLSKCLTRFNLPWRWNGERCILQSRAIDETGYVQPTYAALRAVRGSQSVYHNNAIQSWRLDATGEVLNVQVD